jgi:hypothetical protein
VTLDLTNPTCRWRTRTAPLNLGPQESAELDLFFLEIEEYLDEEHTDREQPLFIAEDWEQGVPLTIRDLISDHTVVAHLKRVGGEERVDFGQ